MTLGPNELTAPWKEVEWVLTDVDDTLTWQGRLPPETLVALNDLQSAGIKVVAVTGACAGWCDHIAQLWPVDAVLGENGAFTLQKHSGRLTLTPDQDLDKMQRLQEQLKHQIIAILSHYPGLNLTLDQSYRLCEVAIDIGQNCPQVDQPIVDEIVAKIHALGANATVSSIHINAWYGDHSKKVTSIKFLEAQGLSTEYILDHCCYVGDSLNDQPMFEALPKSVGVANISEYWSQLSAPPSIVMSKPGGYGFAEFTQQLLKMKNVR